MMSSILKVAFFSLALILFSCTTQQVEQQHFPKSDGRYDSEFPMQSVSDELDYLSKTVRKLDCLVFYMTYVFPPDNPLDKNELTEAKLKEYSVGEDVTNESVSGTATIVYFDGQQIGLLTCAHVVDFPDTLFNYYAEGGLQSISIKLKQQNFVSGLPDGEEIEVIALDKKKDIALISKHVFSSSPPPSVLRYPIGKTKDLEWGTVVYAMGYPLGNLMVTRAIVSNPDKTNNGKFLTDALYNHGISGAPVLALRDGVPNFEWVGMASTSSAESIHYLKPAEDTPKFIAPNSPYSAEIFIDYKKSINYGVTFSVGIEEIVKFLSVNKKMIQQKGFDSELFFK